MSRVRMSLVANEGKMKVYTIILPSSSTHPMANFDPGNSERDVHPSTTTFGLIAHLTG
jgi:hypothetical protein